jgi:hypothetical protein
MNSLDTFTLELKVTYEIIPTPDFKDWVSTDRSRAGANDARELSDLTGKVPDIQDTSVFDSLYNGVKDIYNNYGD